MSAAKRLDARVCRTTRTLKQVPGEIAIAVVVDAQKGNVAPQLEEDELRGE